MKEKLHLACQYFLNHSLREEELRKQVSMLAEAGYECIYFHTRSGAQTPYFSRKWWDSVLAGLDECIKHHIKFGIWDEDGYPSAIAGGRVTEENPQFLAQNLFFSVFPAAKGTQIRHLFNPDEGGILRCFAILGREVNDITEYCGTIKEELMYRQITRSAYTQFCKIAAPHPRAGWNPQRSWMLDWTAPADCRIVAVQLSRNCPRHSVDILNEEAVAAFIRHTHEEYLKHFGATVFERHVASCFMDEPAPGGEYPWTYAFPDEYRKRHGGEILDLLPHLVLDLDDSSLAIRHAYRETQAALQCENYLAQIRSYCHKHKILCVGHLCRTEVLSGNNAFLWPDELHCSSYFDIPCTDPLGYHVALPDSSAYHTALKVVASAATLYGREQAGSDALAVIGCNASLAELMFQLDYQIAMGITYFNIHGLCASIDGARKDEAPPSLFYQHTQWPMMGALLTRTKRLCQRMSAGKRLCDIAVFYPDAVACTPKVEIAFHKLLELLLSHQKDCDLVDAKALPNALAAYQFFLLPECRCIDRATAVALERFACSGGTLIVTGELPLLLESGERWLAGAQFQNTSFLELLPGPVVTGENAEHILLHRRTNGTFCFNRSVTAFRGTVNGEPVWIPPQRGEMLPDCVDPLAGSEPDGIEVEEFDLTFGYNHVPLCAWYDTEDQRTDLLLRTVRRKPSNSFRAFFLWTGEATELKLVLEESTFSAPIRCLVNGHEISAFQQEAVYDCRNLSADIAEYLRTGSVPTLNEIRFECDELFEIREKPYLYGRFQSNFPYGEPEQPTLTAHSGCFAGQRPLDWCRLGYGTYSGSAEYRRTLEITEPGEYLLNMKNFTDCVIVKMDGTVVAKLLGAPFVASLGTLTAGRHELAMTVFNSPANRDRMAGIPAGIADAVTLHCKR